MARTANAKLAVTRRSLAEDARTPLYRQIVLFLRNKILSGEYPNGSFVPSELEIARAFGVSRITAKRALNELAEAGLAVRQKGRGTRVRNKGGGSLVGGSIQSLADSLRAGARKQSVRVAGFAYVSAPADVALALRLPRAASVRRAERICSADGAPYSHVLTYIPAEIGAGVPIAFAEQAITATLADAELAGALDVPIGSALIRAVRTSFAEDDVPAEYLIAHFAPNLYQFIMTLTYAGAATATLQSL